MTLEDLNTEAQNIQYILESTIPADVNAVIEHAKQLAVFHARSGQMLADAKLLLRKKKSSEISEIIIKIAKESYLSAKAQNVLLDTIAQDEAYLVDWLNRINANCVHSLDLCRSIISKAKEEMRMSNIPETTVRYGF
jgi:excinuclease UvrABC nuclease subunit